MPLLLCPNCQGGMKEINRQGVLIDICTQCQGVWLDRGELTKLLEINQQDIAESYAPQPPAPPRPAAPRPAPAQHYDDRYHSSHHGHYKHRKKSKLESIFDIFD